MSVMADFRHNRAESDTRIHYCSKSHDERIRMQSPACTAHQNSKLVR